MSVRPRNWNRWGPADQRGTLNYITPEKIQRSTRLVRRGRVYSLAIPLQANAPIWPTRHRNWHITMHSNCAGPGMGGAEDMLMMHTHGTTHIDALCHVFRDGLMYNGFSADKTISFEGALRNSIFNVDAIITKGVLIDVAAYNGVECLDAGHAITPAEIEVIARHQRVSIEPGDALLFRTGFMSVWSRDVSQFDRAQPGIGLAAAQWAGAREIVLLGADNSAVECFAEGGELPVHDEFIRNQGGYLVELLTLDELARDKIYEFLLVIAPLRITNGLGSPLNPIALA
jgi:kynurenine formamidase